ncbi:uncharacterized protein LOC134842505 isoform X2 [Symsagittifera roscoffensis]|uniref:uncharacterized protein LOC134842505 isoform X2 n=1 Tax=Symsagittifera roscoffensis TaxID=84072 RepID=UPI00307C1ED4
MNNSPNLASNHSSKRAANLLQNFFHRRTDKIYKKMSNTYLFYSLFVFGTCFVCFGSTYSQSFDWTEPDTRLLSSGSSHAVNFLKWKRLESLIADQVKRANMAPVDSQPVADYQWIDSSYDSDTPKELISHKSKRCSRGARCNWKDMW